jgi:hypothetical protein
MKIKVHVAQILTKKTPNIFVTNCKYHLSVLILAKLIGTKYSRKKYILLVINEVVFKILSFQQSKVLIEYEEGLTPNPDILCNKYGKFPMLYKYCMEHVQDFDYIATGHYARLAFDPELNSNQDDFFCFL